MNASRPLVIGVGTPERGDDDAGRRVALLLQRGAPLRADVLASNGDAATLLAAWAGRREVVVVDALRGRVAGRVHRLGADAPLRLGGSAGSHGLGVADAVGLARALGRLPERLELLGIEGVRFEVGAPLSPDVDATARDVAARLRSRFAAVHDPAPAA